MDIGEGSAAKGPAQTLVEAALEILNTADPVEKARLGEAAARRWLEGTISVPYDDCPSHHHPPPPDRPARLPTVRLLPRQQMPKLGKAGSLRSRLAILHSLVHTESWAIDLSWDIIARFGRRECMPGEFFTDFVRVAQDEGRHFTLLSQRLEELGSFYGAFPAHDGLWDSAMETSSNLLARLAVEHCVHEARGLDVLPTTISRFRRGGDERTAMLLETTVYPEEVTHCAAGIKWFSYLCLRARRAPTSFPTAVMHEQNGCCMVDDEAAAATITTFHDVVRRYFHGPLKPPFNSEARRAAGFGPEWYEPLALKHAAGGSGEFNG